MEIPENIHMIDWREAPNNKSTCSNNFPITKEEVEAEYIKNTQKIINVCFWIILEHNLQIQN